MNILKKLFSIIFLSFFLITPSYAADKETKEKAAASDKSSDKRTLSKESDNAKSKVFSGDGHQLSRSNIHNRKRSEDSRMRRNHLRKRSAEENKDQDETKNNKDKKKPENHNPKR